MKQEIAGYPAKNVMRSSAKACLVAAVALTLCLAGNESAHATAGANSSDSGDPYVVPTLTSSGGALTVNLEAVEETVNIGNGVMANVMAFKKSGDAHGTIPGPELRLKVGDTVTVNFTNNLTVATGIHWHGIELNNASDGTPQTQPPVPAGGTFQYKFKVTRPGIYWYHPHHHAATNQVFKGLYGSIIVEDPYEANLQAMNVIPSVAKTMVISDITVCKDPNTSPGNPTTYDDSVLSHVSGLQLWAVNFSNSNLPSPKFLCEYPTAIDQNGNKKSSSYFPGDVPNVQRGGAGGPHTEGWTVLTNGVQVDARGGTPSAPADPSASVLANALGVQAGQGLRLQIINTSTVRYVRLRLTDSNGSQIPLVRIGGQGGLLDKAVVEGGVAGGFDFEYDTGEILIPTAGRADVVAVIPSSAAQNSVLTLWTEDFKRTGAAPGYAWIPTVPVMHLRIEGSAIPYTIANKTELRQLLGGAAKVEALNGSIKNHLIDPSASGEVGLASEDIKLTNKSLSGGNILGVDYIQGHHDGVPGDSPSSPVFESSARHAMLGNTLELTVTNTTQAHHPFHMHGFSVQPVSLTSPTGPSYNFPYNEFRDIIDVPGGYTLKFRVRLDDRANLYPNGKFGGEGRWVFHCHIFFHHTSGMTSELDVHHPN